MLFKIQKQCKGFDIPNTDTVCQQNESKIKEHCLKSKMYLKSLKQVCVIAQITTVYIVLHVNSS